MRCRLPLFIFGPKEKGQTALSQATDSQLFQICDYYRDIWSNFECTQCFTNYFSTIDGHLDIYCCIDPFQPNTMSDGGGQVSGARDVLLPFLVPIT